MTELIGRNLGRYQIISRVGRGGMARVYKAYQASLDRHVALKVLHGHLAEDPDFVGRFEREAAAVARLRHPNIVQVFDYDEQDDLYFIVMEFVEGPTLKAEINERSKRQEEPGSQLFDLDEVVRLFSALADAIEYAHTSGMIHRDLKPGNIMFTTEGRVMLTDFGLAKLVYASRQSATGALSGTPAYMAPEQVEGGRVDERSDIYSLGVLLFELFTGHTPFEAETPYKIMTMHVTEEVPSLRQFNPDLPAELETVIFQALSKDPAKRYQSGGEFAGAIQEATGVYVVQSTTGGQVAPIATLADSQEMAPTSSLAGLSELSLAAISSPYRGLYAFREEDAPYFFGRETFTEKLSKTLNEKSMAAVIGPSGSGKSSVVYAGLLPKLRETKSWTIIKMRPGSEPFYSLAGALTEFLEPELAETEKLVESRQLEKALREEQIQLSDVISRITQKSNGNSSYLLVVDQFEELYTLCLDERVRHRFPNALFNAVEAYQAKVNAGFALVLTLRADFMSQALADRPFADALQEADVKLGPMTRAELSRAIESPAAKKRVVFEAGLVDRILDDVGDEPGNLPLLEFALTLLWERRSGRRLTHAAYESIGRVEGSLARYADEIYEQLGSADQERARRVFTQMVRPGEGTEDTRRLATREELGDEDWALAQRLADARLVTTGRSPTGQETLEVVHEALIRGWGRLRTWMNSERAFRSWQERMRVALHQWENSDRDEGALLRGAPLAEAEEWLDRKHKSLSLVERDYIQASIDLQDRLAVEKEAQRQRELSAAKKLAEEQEKRAEAEHQRAEEQTKSSRRLRSLAIVLAVVFVLAVIAAVYAVGQSQVAARQADARATEVVVRSEAEAAARENADLAATRAAESVSARLTAEAERSRANVAADEALEARDEAEIERDRADFQARLALARQLAAQSITLQGPQLDLALLLSLEANKLSNSVDSRSSLLSALQANPNLVTYLRGHPSLLQSVSFSPSGERLATAGAEGLVLLWDLEQGEVIREFTGHDPTMLVNRIVFSPDERTLATASDDTSIILWDVASGDIRRRLEGHMAWVQSVDFSPDGRRLISGSGDRDIIEWDVESGEPVKTLSGHSGAIWDGVYSNDGSKIASASADGNVVVWDAAAGQAIATLNGHTGAVFSADFGPQDELLVSSGADANIILWDLSSGEQIGDPLTGHAAGAVDAIFSPDGQTIASSGADSTVRLWDVETQQQILLFGNHNGLVPSVSFSPDGQHLASGDAAGVAIVWDVSPGIQPLGLVLEGHNGAVNNLDFHPAGEVLATTGADSSIRFWQVTDGLQTNEPITHGQRVKEPVTALAFAPAKGILASGSGNGTIMFWDLATQQPVSPTISALTNGIVALDINEDGSFVIAGSRNGFTSLWDPATGNQVGPFLAGHTGLVTDVGISPDGQFIASVGEEGAVIIRSLASIQAGQAAGTPVVPLTYDQSVDVSILTLDFSAGNNHLATGDSQGRIVLWDPVEQQSIDQYRSENGEPITKIEFSPTGDILAVGYENGSISLIDSQELEPVGQNQQIFEGAIRDLGFSANGRRLTAIDVEGRIITWDLVAEETIMGPPIQSGDGFSSTMLSLSGRFIAAGYQNGSLTLHDVDTGQMIGGPLEHESPFLGNVTAVAYSPDGRLLATAGNDGAVVIRDANSHQVIGSPLLGHYAIVVSLAFSPDGQWLASGGCSQFHSAGSCIGGEIIIWDVAAQEPVKTYTETVGFNQALAFSPDGKTLVTNDCTRIEVAGACIEGALKLIDIASGQVLEQTFEGHTGFIWSAAFSPDGEILASGSADNTIILWDVETGRPIGQRLANHGGPVRRVAFSPDGTRLASAGFDNLVFLWDVASGQALGGPVASYANNAMDVAFSPDGKILASSSVDGTATLTDIDLESWRARACRIANRNMRPAEWELFFDEVPYQQTCPEE